MVLSDPQQNYGINSGNEVIRSYDIIAIQPETEKMFQSACTNLDIDIISLDMTVRLPFSIKAGYLRQALARGIAFEVLYGPLIADATARRNIIGNVRTLTRLALKASGILVSSGAETIWQLRAPADVLNLASLMGVPAHIRKDCLAKMPEAVLLHTGTRKHTLRSAITILPEEDKAKENKEMTQDGTDLLEDFITFK